MKDNFCKIEPQRAQRDCSGKACFAEVRDSELKTKAQDLRLHYGGFIMNQSEEIGSMRLVSSRGMYICSTADINELSEIEKGQ